VSTSIPNSDAAYTSIAVCGESTAPTIGCRSTGLAISSRTKARDIVGYWLPDSYDQPIRIGEVTIRSGDLVLGDRDGMVILPEARAEAIVAAAETAIGTENLVRKAILAGTDPQEAYLTYGKF
jgi:hypothetical protein